MLWSTRLGLATKLCIWLCAVETRIVEVRVVDVWATTGKRATENLGHLGERADKERIVGSRTADELATMKRPDECVAGVRVAKISSGIV